MNEFRCKLEYFSDDETHTLKAHAPAHAAVLYAEWSDQQAGEGFSPEQSVCVWVDGQWQQFTVTARQSVRYETPGFRLATLGG